MGLSKKSPAESATKAKKSTKSKKAKADSVVEVSANGTLDPVELDPTSLEPTDLSRKEIISRLSEKLSHFDANIILDAAMLSAGLTINDESQLNKQQARQICLALIKRGGPAYAVGAGLYREKLG